MKNFHFYKTEEIKGLIKDYMNKPHNGYCCGLKSFDNIIRLDKGNLAVFVSTPNTGKSTFINYYSYLMGIKNNWKTLLLSFEGSKARTALDMVKYYGNIDSYSNHTVLMDTNEFNDISDIYDVLRQSKERYNIDMAVIDTFTNLYSLMRTGDTYSIGCVLSELSKIAKETDICLVVTAHTTKLNKDDEIDPYKIFGSSHFYNLSDYIFSIKKLDDINGRLFSELKALKIRDNFDKGQVGKTCILEYNKETKVYSETSNKPINPFNDIPFEMAALKENTTPSNYNDVEIVSNKETIENANKSVLSTLDVESDKLSIKTETSRQGVNKVANIETLKNIPIQIYNSFSETKPFQTLPLSEALKYGKRNCKEKIDSLRKSEYHSTEYQSIKKKLPCLMISCECGKDKGDITSYNHLLSIDIDKQDNPSKTLDEIRDIVNSDPYTLYSSLSCGGLGLFAIIPISDNGKENDFKAIAKALIDYYKGKGITLDGSCTNPNRLRFVSYDDEPYVNEKALIYCKRKQDTTPQYKIAERAETAANKGLTDTDKRRFSLMLKDIQDRHLQLTTCHYSDSNQRNSLYLCKVLYSLFGFDNGLKFFRIMRKQRKGEIKDKTFYDSANRAESEGLMYGFGAIVELYKQAGGDYDNIKEEEQRQYEEENNKRCYIDVSKYKTKSKLNDYGKR